MNHRMFRRASALLLSAVLCGAAAAMTGCSGSSEDETVNSTYYPFVPDSKIDESVPGETMTGGIGDTVDYQGKVSVKLSRVVELDCYSTSSGRTLLAEFSVTNNTDKALDCSWLTHFSAACDGQENEELTNNIVSSINARKYYTATQSDMEALYQAIDPGQTLLGYISIAAPTTWNSLVLRYTPYKYYSNDTLEFTIDESKLTHFADKL